MPNTKFKIIVFITVDTWIDSLNEILKSGFKVKLLVGLNPNQIDIKNVSGYYDVSEFAKKWNIPFYLINDYSLKDKIDIEFLNKTDFNLIWVAGWQRLIPKWLIKKAKYGAIGAHGSPDGINKGRGRSPQNWALMLNCKKFELALFRISPGIDDGPIILNSTFKYNIHDDIKTSYKKCCLLIADMVKNLLINPELLEKSLIQKEKPYYYPKRKASDGFIDWKMNSKDIYNHCRALTKPYPGLRTNINNKTIIVWKCQPFDNNLKDFEEGTIEFIFHDHSLLVTTGSGRLLITNYEFENSDSKLEVGDKFESISFKDSINKIIEHHYHKYPKNIISQRITKLKS